VFVVENVNFNLKKASLFDILTLRKWFGEMICPDLCSVSMQDKVCYSLALPILNFIVHYSVLLLA
jgi:hypothetical protein